MKEPKFRSVTKKAIDELTKDLNFDVKDDLQDWEWLIGNHKDIEKYIQHYSEENDNDKRFALMEIIIQATEDQDVESEFLKYSKIISKILNDNFALHEYSIFYWSNFDNENLEDCWKISKLMREIFSRKA